MPVAVQVHSDLSSVATDPEESTEPVLILGHALHAVGGSVSPRVLVQWSSPSALETWEDELDMRRRYPTSPAWGQAGFKKGGMS